MISLHEIITDQMHEDGVDVLHPAHVAAVHHHRQVHHLHQLAPPKAAPADAEHPQFPGYPHRVEHIGAVSGAADGDEQIPLLAQVAQLLGKDGLIPHVVGQGGDPGQVVGEGNDPETAGPAIAGPLAQVIGQVASGGGAAPVAAQEELPALLAGLPHPIPGPPHRLQVQGVQGGL